MSIPCQDIARKDQAVKRHVGDRVAPDFSRILVPIDFSTESTTVLSYAIYLGNILKSHIRLIHVINTSFYAPEIACVQLDVPRLRQSILHRLQMICSVDLDPLKADCAVLVGSPFQEIANAAKEFDAGMVIMGSHGSGGVKRVLLGSTAERVVRRSPCPVLVIRTGSALTRPNQSPK